MVPKNIWKANNIGRIIKNEIKKSIYILFNSFYSTNNFIRFYSSSMLNSVNCKKDNYSVSFVYEWEENYYNMNMKVIEKKLHKHAIEYVFIFINISIWCVSNAFIHLIKVKK
jgi:hypothetical protein